MDTLYYNSKIYSIDDKNSQYTAIGIDNGKIVFLGTDEDAVGIEAKRKIDLDGKTVLPGFIDSHLHLLNYAFVRDSYKMFDVTSIKEILSTGCVLNEEMMGLPENHWLYGRGWNERNFEDEKRVLTKVDLDKISTDRPILFIRVCGHLAAVNSKAMEIILALENTKDYIEQIDIENGILTEAAVKLCYNAMDIPSVERIKNMILNSQGDLNENGITSIQSDNFLSLPGRDRRSIMRAHNELDEEKKLTLRIREQASFTCFDDMKSFIDEGFRTGQGTDYYRVGPVKLYQDGSLGAKTALLNQPYENDTTSGVMVHSAKDLQECVDYAYKHDMQILIHCIGDRASDMVCDAYESAIREYGKKQNRMAINHLQIVSKDLFDRMKKNDTLAYIQPIFVAGDKDIIEELIGVERAKRSYLWKSMMTAGLTCCGSSDSPVESYNVLESIQVAVTREGLKEVSEGWHPEEKLSVLEAVKLFTINNAYGAFEEAIKGSLEIGKLADLVVLNDDLFCVEPHQISKITVSKTIVGGHEVFNAK